MERRKEGGVERREEVMTELKQIRVKKRPLTLLRVRVLMRAAFSDASLAPRLGTTNTGNPVN
jgi:hypothetical protein